jgi:hypothetical protein
MVMIRECKEGDFEQVLKLLAQLWPEKILDEKELQQVFLRGLNSGFQSYVCAVIEENSRLAYSAILTKWLLIKNIAAEESAAIFLSIL